MKMWGVESPQMENAEMDSLLWRQWSKEFTGGRLLGGISGP